MQGSIKVSSSIVQALKAASEPTFRPFATIIIRMAQLRHHIDTFHNLAQLFVMATKNDSELNYNSEATWPCASRQTLAASYVMLFNVI
jgi:hypothetical protein